ncbi:MAG: 50S ribosomal protein L21 [Acidobacteriota bacterium]
MFAIIQASGRQFRVEEGSVIQIGGHHEGEVAFDQVLLVGGEAGQVTAGAPFVAGAKVTGVVEGTGQGPKVRVFKKKRRKQYRRTKGHRDRISSVRITGIQA